MTRLKRPPLSDYQISTINPQIITLNQESLICRIYKNKRSPLDFRKVFRNHRFDHNELNDLGKLFNSPLSKAVYYAALVSITSNYPNSAMLDAISCCLAECFGDGMLLDNLKEKSICWSRPKEKIEIDLLDLRGDAAMQAGAEAAIMMDRTRQITQEWSIYFYENPQIYSNIDGIIYKTSKNDKTGVFLYERAKNKLELVEDKVLTDQSIYPDIQTICKKLGIKIIPEEIIPED